MYDSKLYTYILNLQLCMKITKFSASINITQLKMSGICTHSCGEVRKWYVYNTTTIHSYHFSHVLVYSELISFSCLLLSHLYTHLLYTHLLYTSHYTYMFCSQNHSSQEHPLWVNGQLTVLVQFMLLHLPLLMPIYVCMIYITVHTFLYNNVTTVFTADKAYREMKAMKMSQSIIVSG